MTREELKQQIISGIKEVEITGDWHVLEGEITAQSITDALKTYHNVEIPDQKKPIVLDEPIILGSNSHLKFARNQKIERVPGNYICLARNENVISGTDRVPEFNPDTNISIQGGIWQTTGPGKGYTDKEATINGCYSCIILSNVEQVHVSDLTVTDCSNYGVQICNCKSYIIEDLFFDNHHKDGVHVNGPADYGVVRRLSGDKMGDDMVALNAWDWIGSSFTFGSIEHLIVEDVQSTNNEIRLLPGQKLFQDSKVDCDIRDCVLENISGIYTFKLYGQPNIANVYINSKLHDVSGTPGTIENVYFKNISFVEVSPSGLNGLPVKSMFDICADCNNLYFEDINVNNTIDECNAMDVKLIAVGPLSATWKNKSENPEDWGEVFDPDAICHADNLYLKNIYFAGEKVTDNALLTREVKMTINPDYPNTTPKGGTGYGTIGRVIVK